MSDSSPALQYDLVIVGGGMVGASLACALGGQALRVAVVEAVPYQAASQPSYDDRAIALSFGTHRIFQSMGLWPELAAHATPIKHIHVSEQGALGVTRLHHFDENVAALGYVITARDIGRVLVRTLKTLHNVDIISPAQFTRIQFNETSATATVDKKSQTINLECKLLVAADGGQSTSRQLLGVAATRIDYAQSAIITNISTQLPHNNVAYERFTPNGPLALLPMSDDENSPNRHAVVWTHPGNQAQDVARLEQREFLQRLQTSFGNRLGKFLKVGERSVHPLYLMRAQEQVRPRAVLIGNAAHTLHPIAGQGFNLGLRDVAALAEVIVTAQRENADIGELALLQQYAQWRETDHKHMIGLTDSLVRLFSNRFPLLQVARTGGLLALDSLPPARHLLANHTMGLAGKLPKLARGLAL